MSQVSCALPMCPPCAPCPRRVGQRPRGLTPPHSPLPATQCLCMPEESPSCALTSSAHLPPASPTPSDPTVAEVPRVCTEAEFACHSYNECVALEYRCDRRPDCRDMSDELNCGEGLSGGQ